MLRPIAALRSTFDRSRQVRTPLFTTLAALLLTAASAHAQTWNETGPDAVSTLPGNATSGSGLLTRINGAIGNAGQDADLYQIRITNPAAFTATTVGQTTIDTQMFLFDSSGRGITFNDDATASIRQSTITGSRVPAAGVYYLAVSPYDHDPQSAGGDIWLDNPFTGERAPDGAGAAGTLTGWSGANVVIGAYGINLTGASFFVDTTATCPPNFAAVTASSIGTEATAVAVGDLNGDGMPDLAVASRLGSSVSVLLGAGSGTFGAATNFAAGTGPFSVAIADLNADGKPDLAVANRNGSNLSVLLGTGTGSFGAPTNFATGTNPTSVAIADLNADGRPDLAVTNENSFNVSILLGNGNGTFGAATNFGVGPSPTSVAIADLNADGKPDLAVANSNGSNASVLLGNGSGGFAAATNFATGTSPRSVAIGDLNADGKPDLAVANQISDSISVLLGTGNGSFGAAINFSVGDAPLTVAIGDFNADGKPDLATANDQSQDVSILLGTGTGAFGASTNFPAGPSPRSVTLRDLNADGRLDVVVANLGGNTASVLLQQPGTSGPTITTHPTSLSIPVGNLAMFTVAASGSVTYQWRRNGVNLSDVGEIAGSSTATLQILPSLLGYDNSAFDCVVTNACGSTTSRPASLSLIPLCPADVDDGSNTGTRDDGVDINDLLYFLFHFESGC
jgi:hypothetical protein